jgi:hypothetical protein
MIALIANVVFFAICIVIAIRSRYRLQIVILAFVSALAMIMLELGSMKVLAQQLAGKYSIQVMFFALIEEMVRVAAISVLFFKIVRSDRALNLETILFVGVCIGGVEYFFHLLNWSIAPTGNACAEDIFPPLCKNVMWIFPFFIHIAATFGYSAIVQLPRQPRPLTLFAIISGFFIALMVHAGLNLFIIQRADVPGYFGPTGFACLIMGGSLVGLGIGYLLRKVIEARQRNS